MEMEAVIYSRSNSILIFYLNKYGFIIILLDKKKIGCFIQFWYGPFIVISKGKILLILVEGR